jgi:1,2-phenylacetyl-CoA epoxidase catalytic subunit
MTDFLKAYSIQYWLESCPQGYLLGTEFGHELDDEEPAALLESPLLREQAIRTTVQLIAGERCALHASSGLIRSAPDEASKRFLATQTLDEARHVEVFTKRLFDLGVKKDELEDVIVQLVNPNLVRFAEVLLEKVDAGDYVAGVVGQNVILEGMAFAVFEMLHSANREANPKFGRTLGGTIADERRHVGFGENSIGGLIQQHPEAKADVEKMQKEMSYYMLATFSQQINSSEARAEQAEARKLRDARGDSSSAKWQGLDMATAAPDELESALSETILSAFKVRLGRMGLEYQTPQRP